MKWLFVLSLVGCNFKTNQAQVEYTLNGNKSVNAQCGSHIKECYQLLQKTCNSSYRVLFIEYTGFTEYTIIASCDSL